MTCQYITVRIYDLAYVALLPGHLQLNEREFREIKKIIYRERFLFWSV